MARLLKRSALILGLALVGLGFVGHFVTPWPSVLVVRSIFDRGSATASEALEKHVPAGVVETLGVRYDANDPDAFLDVYRPANVSPQAPTVVWIHGGGFVSGRRGDIANYLKVLAGRGFVTVSVDYTLAPTARYPTPVRQVASALAFLDREGPKYGVNRNALILAGDSAGAQLAAQSANIVTSPAYSTLVGIPGSISPRQVKGVLLHCGIYDVTSMDPDKGGVLGWFVRTVTWSYSGKRNWREAQGFETMSVARHVTGAFPPAFISVGNADPLGYQSRAMAEALRAKGVATETLFYPADHPAQLSHEYQFNLDQADGQRALDLSVAWLNRLAGPEMPVSSAAK